MTSLCEKIVVVVLLSSCLLAIGLEANDDELQQQQQQQDLDQVDWWKKSTYYHIYLRSFKDSNGDGDGDLRGVIEKLDYLQQINVGTILMAPFYSSPMKDGGYDIDDYIGINPMFGTMKDFEDLVAELKKRNMKIVVDFVPNHSSNKHKWFELSERSVGKYRDYYIWTNSTRYQGKYPSNWISVFGGGPAWTYSKIRNEFYLHQFLPEQPDLNFTNPEVRKEFKDIARFWLRKGADGLRVDSAIYLIEDTINYSDEPEDPNWRQGDDPADRLRHMHTRALHESAEIVKDWRQVCQEPEFVGQSKIIITEAYDAIPKLIEYYGNSPRDRFADMPFNFELLKLKQSNLNGKSVEQFAMNWIRPTRELGWPDEQGAMAPWICWVTGNHDNKRLANRIGLNNVLAFKWITYLLPGVPVNYYGDEIPIHDSNYNSIKQKTIDEGEPTRLPFRAPIAWTNEHPSGGFSNSSDIWLPLNANFDTNNVRSLLSSESDELNHLKLHLKLEKIRQNALSLFIFGDLVFYQNQPVESDSILALARTHEKFGNLLLLVNFNPDNRMVVKLRENKSAIRQQLRQPPERGQVVMINFEDQETGNLLRDGQIVALENLSLAPLQAVLFKF